MNIGRGTSLLKIRKKIILVILGLRWSRDIQMYMYSRLLFILMGTETQKWNQNWWYIFGRDKGINGFKGREMAWVKHSKCI